MLSHKSVNDFTTWCSSNNLELNVSKTKELAFNISRCCACIDNVVIDGQAVEIISEYIYACLQLLTINKIENQITNMSMERRRKDYIF